MKNDNYDSIIIGSGIGGLTLAALLTHEAKQKVLVLEKNDLPGGYACDIVSMHSLGGFTPGSIFWNILDRCRLIDKVEIIRPKALLRCIFPDEEIVVPEASIETYKQILIQRAPREEKKILEILDTLSKYHDEILTLFDRKIPLLLELLVFSFRYPTIIRYNRMTVADFLSGIRDQRVKDIINLLWPWWGLPPSQLSMNFFALGWTIYYRFGGYVVKGGGQALANALVASISEGGSLVKLKTAVKKILIEKGKAVGVETQRGERFFARNIVSNANIPASVFQLVGEEHFPKRYINKIKSQIPSISAITANLWLDRPIRDLGIEDYLVYLYPSYDPEALNNSSVKGDFQNVLLAMQLYSNIDESIVPKGKGVMSLITFTDYDTWKNLSEVEYQDKKKEVTRIFIERAEKIIPGLSKHVENCRVVTPLDMEDHTGNYKGAIYGYAQTVNQSGPLNRVPQVTPVKNLYYVGAWTYPGHGYIGVMLSANELFKMLK